MSEGTPSSKFSRSHLYALCGFFLGILAPIGWIVLRLALFWESGVPLWDQIVGDIYLSLQHLTLYMYMGGGTALVLALFGYLIGTTLQQVHERARNLDDLNRDIAVQKEEFERRFRDLNSSIKNFHAINTHIQKTLDPEEVQRLAADGLHEILGYDRVNILMVDRERQALRFVASRGGENEQVLGLNLSLDERAGALYQAIRHNRVLLVEDATQMEAELRLRPPYDQISQLRSKSFIICPIVIGGEVVGLFGVDNKQRQKPLDDTDVDTVKLFADQVSATLTKINLLKAVERLTQELQHTFSELLKYRDQHRQLDQSLNHATSSTTEAISEIAEAAGVIREAVDATRSTAGEMSVSIEQVSNNLHRLTDFIDGSISSMTEISATIKSVEENGIRSHSMSETVMQRAESGARAVADALNGFQGISKSVDDAVEAIRRLSQKGDEIDNITTVINEITQKTNLLALNAAIIAAQAGEQGRSFAVVADEVRSLSLEASNSTGAIAKIIAEIQNYTRQTVEHIGQTRSLVRDGISLGQGMERALGDILDSAAQAMDMALEIRTATQEVSRSVESVSRSITELGEMSGQVSQASKEQTQGTRNIAEAIEEIKTMTDDMVRATEKQQRNTADIESAVGSVSAMALKIFSEMEQRQQGSQAVISSLEQLKSATLETAE